MKIQFWSVGKNHEHYVEAGVSDFTKRANNYFPTSWKIIAPPKNQNPSDVAGMKKREAEIILRSVKEDDFLIVLDEKGKPMSSSGLASFLQSRANESARQLVFLIGGAFGIDASVQARSDYTWSLSELTFPHQLVRLLLAEQVYRACTILKNEKYHHS